MNRYYSPHTREHIKTDNPAPWMGIADTDAPEYNEQTQGCFWKDGVWEIIDVVPNTPSYAELRAAEYPPLSELADALYWNSQGDSSHLDSYYEKCSIVKQKYPKS